MRAAFVIDPIGGFDPVSESTFFLMHEMTARGWTVFGVEPQGLCARDGRVIGRAKRLKVFRSTARFSYRVLKDAESVDLAGMDAVLLRKDPPVDLNFIDHLTLLEGLKGKTKLVNDPAGIKSANEKILPLRFPGLAPPSLVARDSETIRDFVAEHRLAVLKPLNLSGGRGVVIARRDDASLDSVIDLATASASRYVMAQKYLPAAKRGDKRILLLDGEILGAFLRVPRAGDFRGNLHSGAILKKAVLTPRDKFIVDRLRPALREMGLAFVGLDVIGNYLTEINVTSPMGLGEINRLSGKKTEKIFVDWLETQL